MKLYAVQYFPVSSSPHLRVNILLFTHFLNILSLCSFINVRLSFTLIYSRHIYSFIYFYRHVFRYTGQVQIINYVVASQPFHTDRYNSRLFSLLRQFFLAPNKISMWISELTVVTPDWMVCSGVWSIPSGYIFALISVAVST